VKSWAFLVQELIRIKASHYIFKNVRQSDQMKYLIRQTTPTTRMNIYIVSPIPESIHITRPYLEYELVRFHHPLHPLRKDLDEFKDGSLRIYQYLGVGVGRATGPVKCGSTESALPGHQWRA